MTHVSPYVSVSVCARMFLDGMQRLIERLSARPHGRQHQSSCPCATVPTALSVMSRILVPLLSVRCCILLANRVLPSSFRLPLLPPLFTPRARSPSVPSPALSRKWTNGHVI